MPGTRGQFLPASLQPFGAFWKARFARLARHIGDARAIVAFARQMLVSVWYLWHNRTVDRHSDVVAIAR